MAPTANMIALAAAMGSKGSPLLPIDALWMQEAGSYGKQETKQAIQQAQR